MELKTAACKCLLNRAWDASSPRFPFKLVLHSSHPFPFPFLFSVHFHVCILTGPGETGAGRYGDYRNCDTPTWTLEGLFTHLSQQKVLYLVTVTELPTVTFWL